MQRLLPSVSETHQTLSFLQRELEQAKNDESNIEESIANTTNGLTNTKDTLDGIKDTHEYQMMVQRSY